MKSLILILLLLVSIPSAKATPQEDDYIRIINTFRQELGLSYLAREPMLDASSEWHSIYMSNHHFMTHFELGRSFMSKNRIEAQGLFDFSTGEIIAKGSFEGSDTFIQWFFSHEHMEVMTSVLYTKVGVSRIGCESDDDRGYCYWTSDFSGTEDASHLTPLQFTDDQLFKAAEKALKTELDPARKATFVQ